jgi:hypothetical protein
VYTSSETSGRIAHLDFTERLPLLLVVIVSPKYLQQRYALKGSVRKAQRDKVIEEINLFFVVRVRPKINLHFQVLRRLHGKAREGRIAGLFNRRATQPCGMDRRMKV